MKKETDCLLMKFKIREVFNYAYFSNVLDTAFKREKVS